MPELKFTNEKGQTFEIKGISVDEIARLAGLNGHNKPVNTPQNAPQVIPLSTPHHGSNQPDYAGFKDKLTPKARQFLAILDQNPNGISADHLASQLGFESGVQLGGMAGGGLAKHANDFNVDLSYVYTREKTFTNGIRRVIYKPGAYIKSLL